MIGPEYIAVALFGVVIGIIFGAIPGMTVICPADANEAKAATMAIAEMNGPVYMRLARLATPVFEGDMVKPFEIGKANVLREGKDVAIFATGLMVSESLAAAEKLASQIAANAPIAVRAAKKAINEGLDLPMDEAVVVEEKAFGSCFQSADQQEGMGAFLEKRKHAPFTNQ